MLFWIAPWLRFIEAICPPLRKLLLVLLLTNSPLLLAVKLFLFKDAVFPMVLILLEMLKLCWGEGCYWLWFWLLLLLVLLRLTFPIIAVLLTVLLLLTILLLRLLIWLLLLLLIVADPLLLLLFIIFDLLSSSNKVVGSVYRMALYEIS